MAEYFRKGDVGFAKVRAVTRVASAKNEKALVAIALENDADTVIRRCDEYRWGKEGEKELDDGERDRQRFVRRSLTTSLAPDGSTIIRIVLPPEMSANVLRCLEHQLDLDMRDSAAATTDSRAPGAPESDRPTSAQRRADAIVSMAEASLSGGSEVSSADRNQVIALIDAEKLEASVSDLAREPVDSEAPLPLPVRASIAGIAGGATSVAGSTTLCRRCHSRVHDEDWVITRIPADQAPARKPVTHALLDGADERTQQIVGSIESRRPLFHFNPRAPASERQNDCCRESGGHYRIVTDAGVVYRSRPGGDGALCHRRVGQFDRSRLLGTALRRDLEPA